MKRLILLSGILFFMNGCLYINRDVGLTTYQYEKCVEYYDENGTYHKDCPDSLLKKSKDGFVETTKGIVKKSKELFSGVKKSVSSTFDFGFSVDQVTDTDQGRKKRVCICKKSCMKSCTLSKRECIKKCCHEKR